MNVVILHDDLPPTARPDELDVLVQAQAVGEALTRLGHTAGTLSCPLDLPTVAAELQRRRPDRVFNIVESVGGRGRLIHLAPALLDALGLPYTGASTTPMFVTSNKVLAKRVFQSAGIPTPPWIELGGGPAALPAPGRYIIKSVWEEASLGLEDDSIIAATDAAAVRDAIAVRVDRLGGEAFAEAFIAGREFNLSVLAGDDGPEVLPPAEIHFVDYAPDRPRLVGYRAKWDPASFEYHHTPRSFEFPATDRPLLDELRRLARACWELLGLRGYARVDFRVDTDGRPWVLEVNANPCLSPDAGFPAAAQQGGVSFDQVIARILADVPGRIRNNPAASIGSGGR